MLYTLIFPFLSCILQLFIEVENLKFNDNVCRIKETNRFNFT